MKLLLYETYKSVSDSNVCSRNGWVESTDLIPCLYESCLYPGEVDPENPLRIHRDDFCFIFS